MNQPLCADPTCSNVWAEHDTHDGRPTRGRPSREPTAELCADPDCPMAWAEHNAHAAGGSS